MEPLNGSVGESATTDCGGNRPGNWGPGTGGRGTISISHIEMTFKTRPAIVCSRFGTKAVVVSPCEGIVTNFRSASGSV